MLMFKFIRSKVSSYGPSPSQPLSKISPLAPAKMLFYIYQYNLHPHPTQEQGNDERKQPEWGKANIALSLDFQHLINTQQL